MKKRAAMRDQIPLRRPLFGVEPSGRHKISNERANFEERQISKIFSVELVHRKLSIVKNSDSSRANPTHIALPKQASVQ
jgi:hypothetical protein